MKSKKIFAVILCLVLSFLPVFSSLAQAQAPDVKGHWAEEVLTRWLAQGLAKGCPDGTFKPNQDCTRAEFMAFANRFFGFTKEVEIDYSDVVKSKWYYKDAAIAAAEGYMVGDAGKLRPEDPLTRQEVAAIIVQILHMDTLINTDVLSKFTDAGSISDWAAGAVKAVAAKEYMIGKPDKTFGPLMNITRAETVVTLDHIKKAFDEIHARQSIKSLSATNGNMILTLSGAVKDLVLGDFNFTATLNGNTYAIQNLTFNAVNLNFGFSGIPMISSSQTLVITVAAASASEKITGSASATVIIPAYVPVNNGNTNPPANSPPTTPVITRTPSGNITVDDNITITASSTDPDGDAVTYEWEGRPAETSKYPRGMQVIKCTAVDEHGARSGIAAITFLVLDSGGNSGGMLLTGPESRIYENGLEGFTITDYTFNVPYVEGHYAYTDYGRVMGLNCVTHKWDVLQYGTTFNGISFTKKLDPGIYNRLEFYYYTPHNCMYKESNITYTVNYTYDGNVNNPEKAPVAANPKIIVSGLKILAGFYDYSDVNGDLEGYMTKIGMDDNNDGVVDRWVDQPHNNQSFYQWYRADDAAGTNKAAIDGATDRKYILTSADDGKYITFEVTPRAYTGANGTDTGTPVQSTPSLIEQAAPQIAFAYITGAVKEGGMLTGNYIYTDINGDEEGTSTYQWYTASDINGSDRTPISGATAKTYTVAAADNGKFIFFEATPVAQTGTTPGQPLLGFPVFVAEAPPFAAELYIRGINEDESGLNYAIEVGSPVGGFYLYLDQNGDAEGASAYKWYSADNPAGTGKTAITGATGAEYMLTPQDESKFLFFEVTPAALNGATPGHTELSTPQFIPEEAPQLSDYDNRIIGDTVVGETLTVDYRIWDSDGDAEANSVIQWYRSSGGYYSSAMRTPMERNSKEYAVPMNSISSAQAIPGATGKQYTLTAQDCGFSIYALVTPVAETGRPNETIGGSSYRIYASGVVTADYPPVARNISISGTFQAGRTLTGSYQYYNADNNPEGTSTYQWYRADDGYGTNKVEIPGATGLSYTLTTADIGKFISFAVTPAAQTGSTLGSTAESDPVYIPASVVSVAAVSVENVVYGTPLNAAGLPVNVQISLDSGAAPTVDVAWDGGTPAYDGNIPGTYMFTGTLTLPSDVINPLNLTASVSIVVAEPVSANAAPVAANVAISGIARVDNTLTGSYTYQDTESDVEGASLFKWYRADDAAGTNKLAIAGEVSKAHVLQAEDAGKYISFEVIPVAVSGTLTGIAVESTPVHVDLEITAVTNIANINVANGTLLSAAGLPAEVGVTFNSGLKGNIAVAWDGGNPAYDGSTAGTYGFIGTLALSAGVTNPGGFDALVCIVVLP